MKKLLIMTAVMLASTQVFALGEDERDLTHISDGLVAFSHTLVSSSVLSSPEEENPDRPNVLIINAEEIYEATGVTEQELLIQLMQGQE